MKTSSVSSPKRLPTLHIICPFCGRHARLGDEGAAHENPVCATFDDLDPEDYVHEVHEILSATKGIVLNVIKPEGKSLIS